MRKLWMLGTVVVLVASLASAAPAASNGDDERSPGSAWSNFGSYQWERITPRAEWPARAGLGAVELWRSFFVMGGRSASPFGFPPGDPDTYKDVWKSDDRGQSWVRLPDAPWPARSYFQTVTKGARMYVMGGQNSRSGLDSGCNSPFANCSDFFSDVWSSADGANWRRETPDAGWAGRAGLSAVVHNGAIYVLGGSRNDDSAIAPGPGPAREYFNDVWRSYDGRTWKKVPAVGTTWKPRAGASVVSKDGWMYLIGGEEGFDCSDPTKTCPPYFNDVWRSRDGSRWEQVTPAASWSGRPGQQCKVLFDTIVCFGGFGLPVNPLDAWTSTNGADWTKLQAPPWNATTPAAVKYDFAAFVTVDLGRSGLRPAVYTFGGDRETFDFTDPLNPTRIDNDVWRFVGPAERFR